MKTRILSMTLTLIMLAGIIPLSSCGTKTPEPVKSKVDHVYNATEIDLGETKPQSLLMSPNGILIFGYEVLDTEEYKTQTVLLEYDLSDGISEKTVLFNSDDNPAYVQQVAACPDGSILLLRQRYDSEKNVSIYSIERMTDGKSEMICDNLNALFESTGQSSPIGGGNFYVRDFTVDGEGNICVACSQAIVLFDKDFKKLFEIEISGSLNDISATSDGRIYASFYDNETKSTAIRYLDFEKNDFGDEVPLPDSNNVRDAKFLVGPGYDIYYNDGYSIYGFNADDAEPTELLNFINSDVNPTYVSNIVIIDADTMICSSRVLSGNEYIPEVLLMKRVPDDEIPEKYVIRVAYLQQGFRILETSAVNFNRTSDEYRIELINYQKFATEDDPYGSDKLESEILAGTAPDIIELSAFDKASNWINQGALADLNKLIEKDENFERSEYFERVLDEYTDEKGSMYEFVVSFVLSTLIANSKFVGFDHWDADKFVDFASNLPDDKFLAKYIDRQTMLYMALACSLDSYIDYENATCSFDSDSFRKLLELAKNTPEEALNYNSTLSGDELADYNADRSKPYREGKIILSDTDIYRLSSYVGATVKFGADDDVVFVGYPTNSGNGTIIRPTLCYGINDKSPQKEGAWEFIKTLADLNTTNRFATGFPLRIDAFDEYCESELGRWYYLTYSGTSSFSSNLTYEEVVERVNNQIEKYGYESNGAIVKIDESHGEALKELINGAQAYPDLENKIFEIINEETEMYFSGAKSLDETVKIIQDRVSTYISEKS